MKRTPDEEAAFMAAFERSLFDMAEAHRQAMKGMSGHAAMRYVRNIVDSNDLVFGVFPDADDLRGYGMHIIKGKRELTAIQLGDASDNMRTGAVPCDSPEQAVAAEQTIGDGARKSH